VGLASVEMRGNPPGGPRGSHDTVRWARLTSSIEPQLALPCPDFFSDTLKDDQQTKAQLMSRYRRGRARECSPVLSGAVNRESRLLGVRAGPEVNGMGSTPAEGVR
jgi:hypothetical protein